MGFVGKAVAQLTGADKAANATRDAANAQAAATQQASQLASASALESAAQATRQQQLQASRDSAVGAAADSMSKPTAVPDVQLAGPQDASAAGTARLKRATYGTGYQSGVNI
jgi:hypothetical protein